MLRLLRSVLDLILTWWNVDRIRVSPREGGLLRLVPGSIVCVAGTPLEITGRVVHGTSQGDWLQYRCSSTQADGDLWISTIPVRIHWCQNGHECELTPDEIELWSKSIDS
jgi:hypothetical protein